jgi:hypothetical protein
MKTREVSAVANDFSEVAALGYEVEVTGDDDKPYRLTSRDRSRYTLVRGANRMMLSTEYEGPASFNPVKIIGRGWFLESNGKLRPC